MYWLASALLATPAILAAKLPARDSAPFAFVSSSDGAYKLSPWTAPVKGTVKGTASPDDSSTWALTVDDTVSGHKQKIRGFGAAVTDATVAVFNALPSAQLAALLKELMTDAGANFAMLRHTIASSDLSADTAYTYDDSNGSVDTSLTNFDLGDQGTAMAKLLARMQALQPELTLLGSPWSPPGWMKLNHVVDGTTINNNLNHGYASSYGQYFVRYMQAYAKLGATVNAITIQNEPLNSQAGMPTMYIYADESGSLISQTVGPALARAGLDVAIWAYDHNTDVPSYPQTVLREASAYVKTVAWHCYASNNNWGVLTDFHDNHTGVEQVMTECYTSSTATPWHQAADFTMGPLQNWATGALAWTLGTDNSDGPHLPGGCTTCRGLVTVNAAAGTYTFQVDYYMMAQFSKHMPKGATVLRGTGSYTHSDGTGLEAVATLNPDETRTVVIVNKLSNHAFVMLETGSGETWSGRVYSNSVTTWVLPAAGS